MVAFDVEASRSMVHMGDPEPLPEAGTGAKAGRKEAAGSLMAVEESW